MHYFDKMLPDSGVHPLIPTGVLPGIPLGDFRTSDPRIAHPWKILLSFLSVDNDCGITY